VTYEGNRDGWHIRQTLRIEPHPGFVVEGWTVYYADSPQSSQWPKAVALDFLHESETDWPDGPPIDEWP
jgi:hypothetical protein